MKRWWSSAQELKSKQDQQKIKLNNKKELSFQTWTNQLEKENFFNNHVYGLVAKNHKREQQNNCNLQEFLALESQQQQQQ
jgi:hypothetical protein